MSVKPTQTPSTFIPPPRFLKGKAHQQLLDKKDFPCDRCRSGHHKDCKPRLDGKLCTCSCEIATKMRERYANELEFAKDCDQPIPSVWDVAIEDPDSIFKASGSTFCRQLRRPKATQYEDPIPVRTAAVKTKIPREQLEVMARAGEIPAHFKNGRWNFYISELDTWMSKVATA